MSRVRERTLGRRWVSLGPTRRVNISMREIHASWTRFFRFDVPHFIVTKPALYRGFLHCTAKRNFFLKSTFVPLWPTLSIPGAGQRRSYLMFDFVKIRGLFAIDFPAGDCLSFCELAKLRQLQSGSWGALSAHALARKRSEPSVAAVGMSMVLAPMNNSTDRTPGAGIPAALRSAECTSAATLRHSTLGKNSGTE